VSEKEDTDGPVEITNSKLEKSKGIVPSEETQPPSSLETQMIQRQMSVETSSFNRLAD